MTSCSDLIIFTSEKGVWCLRFAPPESFPDKSNIISPFTPCQHLVVFIWSSIEFVAVSSCVSASVYVAQLYVDRMLSNFLRPCLSTSSFFANTYLAIAYWKESLRSSHSRNPGISLLLFPSLQFCPFKYKRQLHCNLCPVTCSRTIDVPE